MWTARGSGGERHLPAIREVSGDSAGLEDQSSTADAIAARERPWETRGLLLEGSSAPWCSSSRGEEQQISNSALSGVSDPHSSSGCACKVQLNYEVYTAIRGFQLQNSRYHDAFMPIRQLLMSFIVRSLVAAVPQLSRVPVLASCRRRRRLLPGKWCCCGSRCHQVQHVYRESWH